MRLFGLVDALLSHLVLGFLRQRRVEFLDQSVKGLRAQPLNFEYRRAYTQETQLPSSP